MPAPKPGQPAPIRPLRASLPEVAADDRVISALMEITGAGAVKSQTGVNPEDNAPVYSAGYRLHEKLFNGQADAAGYTFTNDKGQVHQVPAVRVDSLLGRSDPMGPLKNPALK